MKGKVLIIDTSILCCWLEVVGKECCSSGNDRWDKQRVDTVINQEIKQGSKLVLPLATIIETGNHIAQSPQNRYECAKKLCEIINLTADGKSPWVAFSDQANLWENTGLKRLAVEWPDMANQKLSLGDATIKTVAEYYAKTGIYQVEILTGDKGLKAYESILPIREPRRRR